MAQDDPKYKVITLIPLVEYARRNEIHRDTAYQRLVDGKLTAYKIEGNEGRTYVNRDEDPKMVYTKEESEHPESERIEDPKLK